MAIRREHSTRPILEPTGADPLRRALQRLRANGLSGSEAAAEMIRKNLYDYLDGESEEASRACRRLRIIKRD